jgi:hypothetical protein
MNLGEFKRKLRRQLQLGRHSERGGDPFSLQEAVIDAANYVAENADCYFDKRATALVEDEAYYCQDEFYRLYCVTAKDASGKWVPLAKFDGPTADQRDLLAHRNGETGDPPRRFILQGVNAVRLDPTPSVSRSAALRFEGLLTPGDVWSYDASDVAETLADTHECPLPVYAHNAVFLYAKYLLARDDERDWVMKKLKTYYDEADDAIGLVFAHVVALDRPLPFSNPGGYARFWRR